ncbi:hypothetical protein [Tropheryma whipplei]|nr:hypothetical protein [Tropheryma whipplei]
MSGLRITVEYMMLELPKPYRHNWNRDMACMDDGMHGYVLNDMFW